MDKVLQRKHKKVVIGGKEYGTMGLMNLRNILIGELKSLDPLEELMIYSEIPTQRDYEFEGLKNHILELNDALTRRLKMKTGVKNV